MSDGMDVSKGFSAERNKAQNREPEPKSKLNLNYFPARCFSQAQAEARVSTNERSVLTAERKCRPGRSLSAERKE